MAKDLFSNHASLYAKYRPNYPPELFQHIFSFVDEKNRAWDCATGNGQAAYAIADHFKTVEATDLSEAQLANARQKSNIRYRRSPAETTPFENDQFDLITVATAYHWLNWPAFHKEATRVGKNGCVVAVWCYYTLFFEEDELNELYRHFYKDITGPYWEKERRYVDEKYQSVQFDFEPLPEREFETRLQWKKSDFIGYLETWSATQTYIRREGESPVNKILQRLNDLWNDEDEKTIIFPLCLRLGRINKDSY